MTYSKNIIGCSRYAYSNCFMSTEVSLWSVANARVHVSETEYCLCFIHTEPFRIRRMIVYSLGCLLWASVCTVQIKPRFIAAFQLMYCSVLQSSSLVYSPTEAFIQHLFFLLLSIHYTEVHLQNSFQFPAEFFGPNYSIASFVWWMIESVLCVYFASVKS